MSCECVSVALPAAVIILCFPVIYMLGALPQLSTFVIWLSEQIEMFIFGGTGMEYVHAYKYIILQWNLQARVSSIERFRCLH